MGYMYSSIYKCECLLPVASLHPPPLCQLMCLFPISQALTCKDHQREWQLQAPAPTCLHWQEVSLYIGLVASSE